jgi:PAS domain S-box-containing protein
MAIYTDITDQRDQEKALRSSEDRLHLITDAIPAMIAYHDRDLRFEFANKYYETIGLNPKEIIGEKLEDVFPSNIYAQILPNIEKTLAGESVTYDNFFPTQDGEGIITQVSLIPDFDDSDNVRGLFVLSFDITERKTAEEEIEKTNMALDAAQSIAKIGSWDKEVSSPNMTWSEEHYRIFGLDPTTQIISVKQFLDLIHPDDIDAVTSFLPRDLNNIDPSFSIDYRIQRPDGTERFVHGEGETIYDAQNLPISFRGTSQDITDRKRSEEALDQARREAEFANKAKSEFLSSMSHELRTPLNAILGYAQLLLQTKKDPLQGRQTKQVNQILVSGQHLLKLINDILDLAKIESGHVAFELTDVDIFEAIEECVSLIASLAERHNISVNLTGPYSLGQVVRADRTRFKQALLNLLSNAIKYNKPNGSVEVNSFLTDKHTIRISVEDSGIGIPMERQPEIFEPFSRLGAEQKGIEGTGIGLTITKQLVELMDGQIGFFSTFDEGSTFWIELPASFPGNSFDSEQTFSEDGLEKIGANFESKIYTLLYIEDDTSNLHLMEELIDNIPNLRLISAMSAEEGLEVAKSQYPDIIFMDINLPGISGLDAMAFLKKDLKTKDTPVIALSAAAMPHDLLEGQKVGFFNYLTKPFDIGEVLANINEALELNTQITYGKNSS